MNRRRLCAAAALSLIAAPAARALPPSVAPPQSLLAPTGSPTPGSTLACGSIGPTLTYQWTRNGAAISGANASTYSLQAADNGAMVGCTVSNTLGPIGSVSVSVGVLTFHHLGQFRPSTSDPIGEPSCT